LAIVSASVAQAATCGTPPGAATKLAAIDGRERLGWIDQRLTGEAARGRLWARAWAIGIGAAGLASLAPVPFVAPGDRIDWYTGSVTAAIGVIPFLVSPLSVTRDAPRLHAAVSALPAGDDDARVCALLDDAERKLAADADNERWQRGWWAHAGNLAFNGAVLLFLGLGYHHWTSGILNGASGALVGEAIIFTQPTGAIEDLAAYSSGDLAPAADGRAAAQRSFGFSYHATF
jgi:hypothetical protein